MKVKLGGKVILMCLQNVLIVTFQQTSTMDSKKKNSQDSRTIQEDWWWISNKEVDQQTRRGTRQDAR